MRGIQINFKIEEEPILLYCPGQDIGIGQDFRSLAKMVIILMIRHWTTISTKTLMKRFKKIKIANCQQNGLLPVVVIKIIKMSSS